MPSEIREWSVPAPVRALLWWPAIAFVLVVAFPDASIGLIIVAGMALAAIGVLVPAVARRRTAGIVAPSATETTVESPRWTCRASQTSAPHNRRTSDSRMS